MGMRKGIGRPTGVARLCGVVLVLSFVPGCSQEYPDHAGRALERLKETLKQVGVTPEGFWTADVAGLYALGAVPREVAEADAFPVKPLVGRPRPFHGYLFAAMQSGPDGFEETILPLKGRQRSSTFAFCAYPVEPGPNKRIYIICPSGFFMSIGEGGKPVLHWPSREERKRLWSRCC